ncbi:putative tricarboxylic transport membrane protein [Aeromonas sp. BIGb0405]|jgi:putative tricarboxylic transport membrane protein|uniref:tripartite tricarboxylate transporter permease n=1 Tax=Aeromonas TaxID=642 RepID=UPI001CCBF75C|nr:MULTISPECIES: tripartite tricarboxylate transporter permease [Aeromonas]MCS3455736.1 putative tricarboxylic transport membrane protein [Aeromonas sp. BIGb0405]MCS3458847.1 putative tricarboxylic transport membrane protein [Aeromonas sp. BIGb0445]UBO72520.1 tripartite tricarboxylate transporter permease [Aeromonas rivuli]
MLDGILQGFGTAMMPINLFMVVLGCFVGTFIGMLPGLGPVTAIALMIPLTYGLDPSSGIILMAGVYYGSMFGGSTASILINTPGCAASMITAIDGYPLARKGHAGKALAIAAYASFVGGTLSAIILMVAAPLLAQVSLSFQSADYFALMVLGLSAVAAFAGKGQVLKGLIMALFGIMISTIGIDRSVGVDRFTFGLPDLRDGFSFLLLAMATFALAEILMAVLRPGKDSSAEEAKQMQQLGSLKLSKSEVKEIATPTIRSSVLGFFIGVLPGAGATIASFMAYGAERNFASKKKRAEFGHGSLTGIAAPEAANNAASSGAFVPLLTLGIPGSGTTALILGALIAYGIQPGPRLFMEHPEVFWSVIISMYLGNVVLLILNLPLIPYLAKILQVPRPVLIPMVLLFSLIGVYLVSFNTIDIYVMVIVALAAIGLRLLNFPMAPMLLGFILGGMLEDNLRRALLINDGSMSFMWERPITLGFTVITVAMLMIPLWQWWQGRKEPKGEPVTHS